MTWVMEMGVAGEWGASGLTLWAMAGESPRKRKAGAGKDKAGSLRRASLAQGRLSTALASLCSGRNDKNEALAALGSGGKDKNRVDTSVRPTLAITAKELGEIAEADFLAKAAGMGMWVAKPWGDSRKYDFIVDAEGRLQRVQVKSAYSEGRDGGYSFRMHGNSQKAYQADEIEVLVAYVVPKNAWYVFPVRALTDVPSLKLFPGSRKSRSKYEKYREAWGILMEGAG